MSTFAAIVLGILIGWLVEWVIDWIYWRRRESSLRAEKARLDDQLHSSRAITLDLQKQLAALKASIRLGQPQPPSGMEGAAPSKPEPELPPPTTAAPAASAASAASLAESVPAARGVEIAANPPEPASVPADDLIVIKGIGPVIARKLNEAGIYTFSALGALTPERLREIVGDAIQRLADEDSIIQQANELARRKQQGG